MNNKLFLVQFNREAAALTARELCSIGFNVDFESEDPDRAAAYFHARLPFVAIFDLATRPIETLALAKKIRRLISPLRMNMILIEGSLEMSKAAAAALPGAQVVAAEKLKSILTRLSLAKNAPRRTNFFKKMGRALGRAGDSAGRQPNPV